MTDYQLIIFDWDGTLMDSQARIVACLEAASDDLQAARLTTLQYKHVIGLGLREAIVQLYQDFTEAQITEFADRYRYHFVTTNETPSGLFKDVRQMLNSLNQSGYMLAVATGKARRGLERVLTDTGLAECFHGSRCADETRSKPHPQMLEELLNEFGLSACEAIMVGDTEYDLLMAGSLGMDALAVSYGVHDKDILLKHQPVACVDSISELSDWFLNK